MNQQYKHHSQKGKVNAVVKKMKDTVHKYEVIFLMNRDNLSNLSWNPTARRRLPILKGMWKLGEGSEDSHKDNELVVK